MKVRKPVRARQIKSKKSESKNSKFRIKVSIGEVEKQLSRVVLKLVYGPGCQTNGDDHL